MRHAILLLTALVLLGQSNLRQAVRDGREMRPESVPELEELIQIQPGDEETRARLLGYYFRVIQREREDTPQSIREARGRHVNWLIRNTPRSELLSFSESFAMAGYMQDAANRESARELWLEQVERNPHDLAVLRNAVFLLQQGDRLLVLDLMQRAYRLSALADRDARYYGTQLGLSLLGLGGDRSELQERALTALDTISDPRVLGSAGATMVSYSLNSARKAITAETESLARKLLAQALWDAPDHSSTRRWQYSLDRLDGKAQPRPAPKTTPEQTN